MFNKETIVHVLVQIIIIMLVAVFGQKEVS
jgi:hypothetical protein